MAWSYRQDGIDEMYSSKPGVTLVDGQTLPSTPADPGHAGDMLEPAEPPAETTSDVVVSGAGTSGCDGLYLNMGNGVWNKNTTLFFIEKSTSYPIPNVPSWVFRRDTDVYYSAVEVDFPWNAAWEVASFGTAPVPLVQEAVAKKSQTTKK